TLGKTRRLILRGATRGNDSAANTVALLPSCQPPSLTHTAECYLWCKRIGRTIVCVHQLLRQQTATAVVQQVSSAVVQQEPSTVGCDLTCRRRRRSPLDNQLCRSGRAALTVRHVRERDARSIRTR